VHTHRDIYRYRHKYIHTPLLIHEAETRVPERSFVFSETTGLQTNTSARSKDSDSNAVYHSTLKSS